MIHIIIMASGFSRRMGQNKLLMDLGGRKVLQWVIEAALKSAADAVTVICSDPSVFQIAKESGAQAIDNPHASLGQSAGIRLAVQNLPQAEAYLFLAGDQPFISCESLNGMLETYRQKKPDILSATWHEKRTLPALFAKSMYQQLLSLEGDQGGRALIDCGLYKVEYQELLSEEETWDIDTADELKKLKEWLDVGATGS